MRQNYYYLNGHRIGDVGNNGPSRQSYAEELAQDRSLVGGGTTGSQFRTGKPVASADFDQNYEPINSTYPGSTAASYTVKTGDTLRSIAQAAWGDSSLWYLIADANGLTSSSVLSAGQILIVPNKVTNLHNNSSTFRVYDAGEAIGDAMPTLPPEPAPPPPPQQSSGKSGGCGGFGAVIAIVVAVVVTVMTAGAAAPYLGAAVAPGTGTFAAGMSALGGAYGTGVAVGAGAIGAAAGSIASQGASIAMGNQDSFSWRGVAVSAVGGAISAGMSTSAFASSTVGQALNTGSNLGNALVNGAVRSVVTQGIGVVTGLQQSFSWKNVAAAAISQGVGQQVGDWIGATSFGQNNPWAVRAGVGVAGGIASAGVRGGSLKDALPGILQDAIGTTIGYQIAGSLAQGNAPATSAQAGVNAPSRNKPSSFELLADSGSSMTDTGTRPDAWALQATLGDGDRLRVGDASDREMELYGQIREEQPTWSPDSVNAAVQQALAAESDDIPVVRWPEVVVTGKFMTEAQRAASYAADSGDSIRNMSDMDAFFTFDPRGQFLTGAGHAVVNMATGLVETGKQALLTVGDTVSYGRAQLDNVVGGNLRYTPQSTLGQMVQQQGLGNTALNVVAGVAYGAVSSVTQPIKALYSHDPRMIGESVPGVVMMAAPMLRAGGAGAVREVAANRAASVIQKGGAHGEVVGIQGYESHHMPADSVSPIPTNKGPAIAMEINDHRATASWGSSREARAYRQAQAELIGQGNFKAAQQMDILDVQTKFGTKYDEAIQQMLQHTKKQGY